MSSLSPPASSEVEQAAWWLAQQCSGEPWTPAQQQALDEWLTAQPSHAQVFERMQRLWSGFESEHAPAARLALQAGHDAAAQRRKSLRSTKRLAQGSTALVLVGWLAWLGWQQEQVQYWAADHRSGKGEIITIELPDQSQLTLGSNSAVNVHYDGQQRRIELVRGDIMAVVAHAPSADTAIRPFIVQTPNATAEALGTIYSVRYRPDTVSSPWPAQGASTWVEVQESSVRACLPAPTPGAATPCQTVQAGQSTRIDAQGLHPLEPTPHITDSNAAPAWTRGQLLVDNLPLTQVLRELGRHRPGWLLFDEQELAGIRVSGVFDLIDTERSLRALQESTEVFFERSAPWITQAQRKASESTQSARPR